jgi:hypothetical protein
LVYEASVSSSSIRYRERKRGDIHTERTHTHTERTHAHTKRTHTRRQTNRE